MMNEVVFLSYKDLPNGTDDDNLAKRELIRLGVNVQTVPWESYENLITPHIPCVIRSPWNYTQNLNSFLNTLESLKSTNCLLNSFETIKNNSSKNYIIGLYKSSAAGKVVPSFSGVDTLNNSGASFEKLVVKPLVGASSVNTFLLESFEEVDCLFKKNPTFKKEDFFIQPYCKEVETTGEVSLIFFNIDGRKVFSHAVIKKPMLGDFRVQEEFGGNIAKIKPPENLITLSQNFLGELSFPDFLFARMDYLLFNGHWCLSEAELIEPDLYLRVDSEAPKKFAKAIAQYCK